MVLNANPSTAADEWRRHWPVAAAATAGMSLAAVSTASFGVMVVPIEEDTGWSRTEISVAPMLISAMVICFATLFGAAIDRLGPRRVALVAVPVLSGAIAMLSQVGTQVWQWWALWAVIGIASAVAPTVWVAPVTRTFAAGRGLAMAIVLSGSGISSTLVPVIANAFVEDHGWRAAYLYTGAIWFAVVFTLVVLFLRTPGASPAPAATQEQAPAPESLPGLTARQGFASAVFYKLLFATVIANFAGIAMMLNLVPIMRWTGLSAGSAAAVFGLVGVSTIVGRLAGGGLMDRFSAGRIAASAAALMAVLPVLLLLFPGSVPASILGVVTYGLMGGAMMPSVAYLASRHLGQRAFGTLYATIMAAMSIGIGLGPLLANLVYDQVQSYGPVLWGALPLFALGALLFATLGPYPDFGGSASRETER